MRSKDIWFEGKWIDTWSINHLLFGVLSAHFLISIMSLTLRTALVAAVIVYVAWEIIEILTKAGETPTGQVMDVFVGIAGFVIYTSVLPNDKAMWLVLCIFIFLEAWGYATKFGLIKSKAN
jgi:hypothetical protein